MRILILGGDGMLGHRLLGHLQPRHEVRATLHQDLAHYAQLGLFHAGNSIAGVDVRSDERLRQVLEEFRPEAMVNAVGIVKQRDEAKQAIPSIEINALLPHRLALLARARGARLVHLSTDCVFSGRDGHYSESSPPDAEDLYGRSKLLGEVGGAGALTLRTSIIGPELSRKAGLLEWFLAQRGSIRGYRRAIYTGFTTAEMSRIIETMLVGFPAASGVYHVSSEPISKYHLLCMIRDRLGRKIEILPEDDFHCDRSLDSGRFRREFGYAPPAWPQMIDELARELREQA